MGLENFVSFRFLQPLQYRYAGPKTLIFYNLLFRMLSSADIVLTSSHHNPTNRQEEYAKICQQIKEHEASIRVLKMRHNALGVTVRIPSEILCMIFEFVAGSRTSPWLFVTHVCTHWRQVALGCPSLWRYIPSDIKCPLILQEEMVSRARGHSLDVKLNDELSHEKATHLAQIAFNNVHRIRTLSIHYLGSDLPDTVIHMVTSKPAPLLEKLEILGRPHDFYFGTNFNLNDAFGGDAPRLHSLHLENFDLLWESYILKNLTTLKLIHPPTQVPLSSILSAISNIANLRILGLGRACIPRTQAHQTVHLPQLHRLELNETLSMCISLLSHVRLSHPKPRFKIEADFCPDSITEVPMMLEGVRGLGKVLSQHNRSHVRCLSVRRVDSSIQFKTWECPGTCLRLPSDAPCLTVALRLRRADRQHGPVLAAFQDAIPNYHLETLHVSLLVLGPHDWRDLFGALPILKNISVKYNGEAFSSALSAHSLPFRNERPGGSSAEVTGSAENPSKLPFKALRCLVTQHCRFGGTDTNLDDLVTTLTERRKRGFPLHELHILHPTWLELHTLERLRKVVKNVYVDPEKVWTAEALRYSYCRRAQSPYMAFYLDVTPS